MQKLFSLKLVLKIGNSAQIGHAIFSGSQPHYFRNTNVASMMNVSWWAPSCTGLELNGMGCSDKGDNPPPLPVKGSTADYGNLLDNQDLMSPSTPPPPPPHQRVGVLIRSERSSLMMHGTCNETRGHYTHLTSRSASFSIPTTVGPVLMCVHSCLHVHACFTLACVLVLHLCIIFVMCVTEECRH